VQDRISIALKWTAKDGSSPLGILLSKYCPEIAAKNANTTTALDCARPSILKRYIDAHMCPSQAQQCKQTGAGGADAEMALNDDGTRAAYTTVEQRESVVHTANGVFRHVEENATAVDPEGRRVNISLRTAIAPEQEAGKADDAAIDPTSLSGVWDDFLAFKEFSFDCFSTQLKEMQRQKENVQGNMLQMQEVQLACARQMHKIENVLLYMYKAKGEQEKELKLARQTQNSRLAGMQREMETMHNYYKKKIDDVVKNSAELKKVFDTSREQQIQTDKRFDTEYENNFNEVKNFINKHGKELDVLHTALGQLEDKVQGPVLPAVSLPKDMLSEMAQSLLLLKMNANGKRAKTKQRSQAEAQGQAKGAETMHQAEAQGQAKGAETMHQDSIKALADVVAGVVHDAQLAAIWKDSSHNATYDKARYEAKAYIMSGEFARDDAAGIFVSHPLENIQIYGKKYTFKTSYNAIIFESAKMTLAETFQVRRFFCQQAERAHYPVVIKWKSFFNANQSAGKLPKNAAADANDTSKDAQNNAAADANDTSKDAQNNILLSTTKAKPSGQAQPSSVGASAHTEHLEKAFLLAAATQVSTASDSGDDDDAEDDMDDDMDEDTEASSTPFENAGTGA